MGAQRFRRAALVAALLIAASCADAHVAPSDPVAPAPDASVSAPLVLRCSDGDERQQRHGSTCLCCHDEFGVAGSLDPSGPPAERIVVTDARGEVATMAPNNFGNFFRHFAMTPPFRSEVRGPDGRVATMRQPAPSADCNVCHYDGSGAPMPPLHGP
jgi:hypothetical protein